MARALKSKSESERTTSPEGTRRAVGPRGPAGKDNLEQHEAIARLAFTFWEARGGKGGSPEEDWLRAERELKAKFPKQAL